MTFPAFMAVLIGVAFFANTFCTLLWVWNRTLKPFAEWTGRKMYDDGARWANWLFTLIGLPAVLLFVSAIFLALAASAWLCAAVLQVSEFAGWK